MRSCLALLLLAACPGGGPEDASQNAPPKTSTTTVSPGTPAATTTINSAPPTTEVQLLEYRIRMSDTLPAGRHHFRIANGGEQKHGFAIEGPGVSAQLANELTRGDIGQITVTLQPGTYRVWCPVDEHRGKGMERTITVH
jgi:uncharacterized cupredoxin-like copper-binding protein